MGRNREKEIQKELAINALTDQFMENLRERKTKKLLGIKVYDNFDLLLERYHEDRIQIEES